jgi:recombinational DNA repair ATPase RecF
MGWLMHLTNLNIEHFRNLKNAILNVQALQMALGINGY